MHVNISLQSIALPWKPQLDETKMVCCPCSRTLSEIKELPLHVDIALKDKSGNFVGWVPYETLIKAVFKEWKLLHAYYEALLSIADDAVTVVDAYGKIVSWNHQSEEMYGRKFQEVAGRSVTEFFQEDAVVLMSTLKEGKSVLQKYNQPQPDMHVLINTKPIYINDEIIGGISVERNISDVVKLNDELATTTAYLHELESEYEKDHYLSPFNKIKGRSSALQEAVMLAEKVSATDATVLVTGESGVGKELFAEAIHKASPRAEAPFIAINCGAIPASLFESELFGYEKGAFTGAVKGGKKGKFDLAKNGTLFLDEIGEMPLELQVKLLRVLQEKQFYRVGGTDPIPIDVRIIAATNRNLEEMVDAKIFRDDLYYRLNVISIHVPPLRERGEDVPELTQLFLKEFSIKYSKPIPNIDPEVMYTLLQYPWPGNIRQLRNVVERITILGGEDEVIKLHHLPTSFKNPTLPKKEPTDIPLEFRKLEGGSEEAEIRYALKTTYGNRTAAAKLLGISRATLYNKMKKHNLCGV
ncbi:sigma-54 interaction domain-containing protein [Bacillus taeanensis]|uniref:Sigma-54-dependent Fis family transcriptional regulator n=1 Tax=Bacillus taeanensis TaxID=273032 RepID=A0A366XWC0_9BACI|nr:sigma 54-interacting transcriptional regulator [Bacillus taeanensis]RBW69069.1 sigma-54-dependent Fis family transcriptional regulator [Bacillus taeanensis]